MTRLFIVFEIVHFSCIYTFEFWFFLFFSCCSFLNFIIHSCYYCSQNRRIYNRFPTELTISSTSRLFFGPYLIIIDHSGFSVWNWTCTVFQKFFYRTYWFSFFLEKKRRMQTFFSFWTLLILLIFTLFLF